MHRFQLELAISRQSLKAVPTRTLIAAHPANSVELTGAVEPSLELTWNAQNMFRFDARAKIWNRLAHTGFFPLPPATPIPNVQDQVRRRQQVRAPLLRLIRPASSARLRWPVESLPAGGDAIRAYRLGSRKERGRPTDRARARSSPCTAAMRFEGLSSWPSLDFVRKHKTHLPLEQRSGRRQGFHFLGTKRVIFCTVTTACFCKTPGDS
jgi:hypothetical protein